MELSRILPVTFNEMSKSNEKKYLIADTLVIEKSLQNDLPCRAYQLRQNTATIVNNGPFEMELLSNEELFIFLGEVITLDKKQRTVSLANDYIVSYNYLIIVTREQRQDPTSPEKFGAALSALIEAIRMQKEAIIPQEAPSSSSKPSKGRHVALEQPSNKELETVVAKKLPLTDTGATAASMYEERQLFELYL